MHTNGFQSTGASDISIGMKKDGKKDDKKSAQGTPLKNLIALIEQACSAQRNEHGNPLSLRDITRLTNGEISWSTVHKWGNGTTKDPGIGSLTIVARALNIPLDKFFQAYISDVLPEEQRQNVTIEMSARLWEALLADARGLSPALRLEQILKEVYPASTKMTGQGEGAAYKGPGEKLPERGKGKTGTDNK